MFGATTYTGFRASGFGAQQWRWIPADFHGASILDCVDNVRLAMWEWRVSILGITIMIWGSNPP